MVCYRIFMLFILVLLSNYCARAQSDSDSLVLLHVLFRHGDRTPNLREVYPKDPYINYTYPPLGYGQLTEAGKLKEFQIGKSLRNNYRRYFENILPDEVVATTSDYDRTKLSCQLVLAGLYSLQEQVNLTSAENSKCSYQKPDKDQILGDPSKYCTVFKDLYHEQSTKLKGLEIYKDNKDFYDYILNNTGWTSTTPNVSSELYYLLKSQETLGLTLPEWTRQFWPRDLSIRAADEYYVHTETIKMKRLATGYFLKKILSDTENVIKAKHDSKKKLYLYSGHDFNTAFLLILLDQFKPHIPPYGAYVTIEVHNINGTNGIKIFYQDYTTNQKIDPLNIKQCGNWCPLDKFVDLFSEYLPSVTINECEKL